MKTSCFSQAINLSIIIIPLFTHYRLFNPFTPLPFYHAPNNWQLFFESVFHTGSEVFDGSSFQAFYLLRRKSRHFEGRLALKAVIRLEFFTVAMKRNRRSLRRKIPVSSITWGDRGSNKGNSSRNVSHVFRKINWEK